MSPAKIVRAAFAIMLLCAVLALFIPAKANAMPSRQASCCVTMKATDGADQCPMHQKAPNDQQEPLCCQICALGLALLFVVPSDFVYTTTGEASLFRFIVDSQSLPHRPPVPPPRAALS